MIEEFLSGSRQTFDPGAKLASHCFNESALVGNLRWRRERDNYLFVAKVFMGNKERNLNFVHGQVSSLGKR